NLKIGETLQITISGNYLIPKSTSIVEKTGEVEVTRTRCERERDPTSSIKAFCYDYQDRGWCGYRWSDLAYQTKEYDLTYASESFVQIHTPKMPLNPIAYTGNVFVEKHGAPIYDQEQRAWKMEI